MNSIMMPAVMVNQIAANTGAVVRNFFMALGDGAGGRVEGRWGLGVPISGATR